MDPIAVRTGLNVVQTPKAIFTVDFIVMNAGQPRSDSSYPFQFCANELLPAAHSPNCEPSCVERPRI